MREIKFRAWDTLNREMHYQSRLAHFQDIYLQLEGGIRKVIGVMSSAEVSDAHPNQFELMQYTGLKDKKGKEIYEGGILDFGDYSIAKYGRCLHVVYWNDGDAGFNSKEIGFRKLAGFGLDETGEVIGNIYENPELLGS